MLLPCSYSPRSHPVFVNTMPYPRPENTPHDLGNGCRSTFQWPAHLWVPSQDVSKYQVLGQPACCLAGSLFICKNTRLSLIPLSRAPSVASDSVPVYPGLVDSGGFVVLVIIVVVVVVFASRSRQQAPTAAGVDLPPSEAIEAATSYMVMRGYTVSYKGETSATFSRPKKPSNDIGCLLLLLGIIPGLLYYGLFRRTLNTSVVAVSGPAGTQLTFSGDDAAARYDLMDWAKEHAALETPEREPCWKCGSNVLFADVRCPSCGAWLRTQS
jgi:hypothetical protein